MFRKFAVAGVLACLLVVPGAAQTASQLLQKGIYAQETSGDLDAAIQIYRQLVGSAFGQRDIAAQAQYRLAETLIRKGDLSSAATEFQKLARDYSDYQALISRLSGRFPEPKKAVNPGPAILIPQMADSSRPVTARGQVLQVQWINPLSYILVQDGANQWAVAMASPNALLGSGLTRNSVKQGDRVIVNGFGTKDGQMYNGYPLVIASTIVFEDGRPLFDRAALPAPSVQQFVEGDQRELVLQNLQKIHSFYQEMNTPEVQEPLRRLEAQIQDLKAALAREAAKQ
jgi:hypothetical protein